MNPVDVDHLGAQAWAGDAVLAAAEVLIRDVANPEPLVVLGAVAALWAPLHGHTCVDLATFGSVVLTERGDDIADQWRAPHVDQWRSALAASAVVRSVTGHESAPELDGRPLVLFGNTLYTQRQWVDECTVVTELSRRAESPRDLRPAGGVGQRKFVDGDQFQQRAVDVALDGRLTVLLGGPGSGKTFTVAQIIAALYRNVGARPSVAIAAPTGKAAARLADALQHAAADMAGDIAAALLAVPVSTVHRLLGASRGRVTRFAHDRSKPLPYDVVVIDEASMVALPLLARLLEALRPDARLIVVGDPDQLDSVEVGSVLADLAAHHEEHRDAPVARCTVRLEGQHRHVGSEHDGSPVADLADAVRRGSTLSALRSLTPPFTSLVPLAEPWQSLTAALPAFAEAARRQLDAARAGDADGALAGLADARVLCAHRHGPYGVSAWNAAIEAAIVSQRGTWYLGRPVMVTRNDPRLELANGQSGVVINASPDSARPSLRVAFAGGRLVHPAQLDAVETGWAITVHKSQGSEYEHVAVVLPPADSPLANRQMLYTAVTRARRSVALLGDEASLAGCIVRTALRTSGVAKGLPHPQVPLGQLRLDL